MTKPHEKPCSNCGAPVYRGYEPNYLDPGDVHPYRECTRYPECDYSTRG